MTGYGKGEYENELYRFIIEIKSVNHRYNDISVKMPRHISYLEDTIKKAIKEKVSRGKVDVYVNFEYVNESAIDVKVDIPLALSYKIALEELTSQLNIEDNIRLNNILSMNEVVKTERKGVDENLVKDSLLKSLDMAITNIVYMKEKEGEELKKDMLIKLDNINKYVEIIEERSPSVVSEYKIKLRERINELLDNNIVIDEERLSSEVAIFADKSSIDEEIVRLKSHIKQFKGILEEDDAIGRKLDFLIQEFNREINTIGSKANDIEISKHVVELKAELEKIREQVQNIE
ncbi:MAG: YicC/YloC family endoribonuclease [Tissierellaceae bacterium]|nr:YicC/YloC family endoribonuclease [Tissierellaceae bacterium]